MALTYSIDGNNFANYGIKVLQSNGVLDALEPKEPPIIIDWPDYHGEVIDLAQKRYKAREIELECYIKAETHDQLKSNFIAFSQLFDKPGLNRLMIIDTDFTPLCYDVYLADKTELEKEWKRKAGEFTLKLREPNPVKKLIRHTRTSPADQRCTITLTSKKMVDIYWGNGDFTKDVSGTSVVSNYDYAVNGTYYIIVAGVIEEVKDFSTNGTVIWNKF